MNRISFRTTASSLLASVAAVGLFAARTAAADPASSSDTQANAESVETVTVTAQRRSEQNVNVPIAITAVSAKQLEQAGIQDLADIAKVAPAVRFNSQGAYVQPTIRGVGTAVVTSGAGSNVGIYIDGFYSPNPLAANFDLLNVSSVQVLKGPQGTLFGRNTTAGAILVTTAAPGYDTSGTLDVSYGNYNAQRYQGYFTTGLTDKLAFDVSGLVSRGDGYVHDVVTGSDTDGAYQNWLVRTGLRYDATNNISFLLRYEYSATDDPNSGLLNAYVANGVPLVPAAAYKAVYPTPWLLGASVLADYATKPRDVALSPIQYAARTNTLQLTSNFDFDFATLTSYTQYSSTYSGYDTLNISFGVAQTALVTGFHPVLAVSPFANNNDRYFTEELLLNSTSEGRLKWTVGAFYMDWTEPFVATPVVLGFINAGAEHAADESITGAVYGDATYQVLDDLYLTAGVRYSHDVAEKAKVSQAGCATTPGDVCLPTPLPTMTTNSASPRAVVRYTPTENSSVYASWSRGFKAGVFNDIGPFPNLAAATVKPETINAYEVGYKYAAHGLALDLAGFYYDYKDLQIEGFNGTATSAGSFTTNAATSRIDGVEAQLKYDVTDSFNVNAGAAYTDGQYTNYPKAAYYPTQCTSTVTCSLPQFGFLQLGSANLKNTTMMRAPKYTANLGAAYTSQLYGGDLVLSGNLNYTSKFYFDPAHQLLQNGYALLGLRAEWASPSGMYTFAIYGNNVTDTNYRVQAQISQAGAGNLWDAPVTYGAEVKVHFD